MSFIPGLGFICRSLLPPKVIQFNLCSFSDYVCVCVAQLQKTSFKYICITSIYRKNQYQAIIRTRAYSLFIFIFFLLFIFFFLLAAQKLLNCLWFRVTGMQFVFPSETCLPINFNPELDIFFLRFLSYLTKSSLMQLNITINFNDFMVLLPSHYLVQV